MSGCSVVNAIDVCDRSSFPERELNARTDGIQSINSPGSLAAMPFGGALAVFQSQATSAPAERRYEVRSVLLAEDGSPIPTCDAPNEHTLAPTSADLGQLDLRVQPSITPPASDDGAGLVVYASSSEDSAQVFADVISGDGCAYATERDPIQISLEEGPTCELARSEVPPEPLPASRCVSDPSAVPLGRNDRGEFDFGVFWTAFSNLGAVPITRVRGRVLRARFGTHEFLNVQETISNEPVDLVTSEIVLALASVSLDDTRFALIWQALDGDGLVTRWRVFDERLNPQGAVVELGRHAGAPPDDPRIAATRAGALVAVGWVARDESERGRVWARYVGDDGALRTDAFLVADTQGIQSAPAVTALPEEGGFLFAWEASADASHADSSGAGIRAAAFTRSGAPRFSNPGCGRRDFQLNLAREDQQRRPSLATLVDGTVVAAWTDDGASGADVSLSSVRGIAFTPRALLPIE